jgi:hypothetical protein
MWMVGDLLKHQCCEYMVICEIPVWVGFKGFVGLVDAAAVGEAECDCGVELGGC